MLAVCIGLMILMVAVPSLSGVFAEQQLHESYNRFLDLAQAAQMRAMSEHEPYVLRWSDNTIQLESLSAAAMTDSSDTSGSGSTSNATPAADSSPTPSGPTSFNMENGESLNITFPAALDEVQDQTWTFWPTGTCEPASVTYEGPHGTWQADFDPLTCVPTLKKDLPQ